MNKEMPVARAIDSRALSPPVIKRKPMTTTTTAPIGARYLNRCEEAGRIAPSAVVLVIGQCDDKASATLLAHHCPLLAAAEKSLLSAVHNRLETTLCPI